MMERTKNIDLAQVYELWDECAAALRDADLERWMSLWCDDGIQMAPDAPPRVGKERIRAAMQPAFDFAEHRSVVICIEEVRILGRWAYSSGAYEFEVVAKEGGEVRSYSAKFLDIVAKQADGSWKIAIDCHNYNEPCKRVWHCADERPFREGR